MNTENFWKLVTTLNWNHSQKYLQHKAYILKNYSPNEVDQLSKVYSSVYNQLAKVLRSHLNNPNAQYSVSDDGFSDLCSEIVGRGEGFYKSVLENPSIAQEMIKNSDYHESFSYCWPYKEDYQYLSSNYYIQAARSHLNTVNEVEWSRFNNEIQNLKNKYENLIMSSLESYNFKNVVEKEYEIIGMQKELERLSRESFHAELVNAICYYKAFMI